MRIGFAQRDITPPVGTELGGYAGFRPCAGSHDPLRCKAIVLEQPQGRYGLVALDLVSADEALCRRIGEAAQPLGIEAQRLLVCAIHTHAAPWGILPGQGQMAPVNRARQPKDPAFPAYMEQVTAAAVQALEQAARTAEAFQVRTACAPTPPVGSNRHDGSAPGGFLTALEFRTQSGKRLTVCNFPCHPTVTNAANLLCSADFVGCMARQLGGNGAVFLNGAAGDISTRFTRRESTFAECDRLGLLAAQHIRSALEKAEFRQPEPLRGLRGSVTLQVRQPLPVELARQRLREHTARWQAAQAAGAEARQLRILRSYVEGAGVDLEFAMTAGQLRQLELPVAAFRFCGREFVTVPGELFSPLQPEGAAVIGYAGGYCGYIAHERAYDSGCYEAMAAVLARGQGEIWRQYATQLLETLREGEQS